MESAFCIQGAEAMQHGTISFVIPVYRNFDGIYPTLDSLFLQDYPSIELIISDDGSPNYDAELPRLTSYIETHRTPNIVRVLFNHLPENQGTVCNANQAYQLATGTYIKDLSPEDTLAAPDALSRYVSFLNQSGCLICFCRQEGVTETGESVPHLASSAEDYDVLRTMSPSQLRNRLFARNCLPAPAWFAKRELFEKYGYYSSLTRLVEDYPYWLHLCNEQVPIAFMDDVLIHYRLSSSGGGNYSPAFIKDVIAINEKAIFPFDRRFGLFQPLYNALKKAGLMAYMDLALWESYTPRKKVSAVFRHGPFFLFIRLQAFLFRMKNRNTKRS